MRLDRKLRLSWKTVFGSGLLVLKLASRFQCLQPLVSMSAETNEGLPESNTTQLVSLLQWHLFATF